MAAEAPRMRHEAGRLLGEQDRHGAALSELDWRPDGTLREARVRVPDGGWITIQPGAGAPGPWGASDLLTRDARPLTRCAALDWARVDRIPPLAEPARLPSGAGATIFNLLARLAEAQGVEVLRYDAPYPTEALFLTLLESFRYVPHDVDDPSAAFVAGVLTWAPAPHDVTLERDGIWVQQRARIEKIVASQRIYYRPDWDGVRRRAPRVIRETGGTVRASLVVLGRVVEDHVVLAPDGRVLDVLETPADPPDVVPFTPDVVQGVIALVVATSTPALAPWLLRTARDVEFAWGPVAGDLVAQAAARITVSHRVRRALADAVRGRSRADALGIALAALREAADLVGDGLRARAQAALAEQPADVQAAAFDAAGPRVTPDARAIAAAADALARETASR